VSSSCVNKSTDLRWEDNVRMDRKVIRWHGVDTIGVTQDRDRWRALVNAVMNLCVP
jgi:plasmid stabilization system protein ParE